MTYNDVQVMFIIPNECEDEKQTSSIMQETHASCKANIMKCSWLREDDGVMLDFKKTDFLIFQDFKGELYERALQTKCVILGPRCLFVCLKTSKKIPNFDWPLYSLTMENTIVACSNIQKDEKKKIKFMVQSMCGIYTNALNASGTHLITDSVQSEKYNVAAPLGIKIMLPSWVEQLWQLSQTDLVDLNDPAFDKYRCPVFHKLRVCATGFTDTKKLVSAVVENGGTFSKKLVLNSTDILICNGSSSEKFRAARKRNLDCVTEDWIFDSLKVGYAIPDLKKYTVQTATSTPTKGYQSMCNISTISAIGGNRSVAASVLQETMNSTVTFHPPKRKSPFKGSELIDCIDVKKAKRAGAFLDGCGIYLAGFSSEQHEKLSKVLNFSGATRYETITERVTHVIVGDPGCHELKLIRAKKLDCYMLSVMWMLDSMERGQCLPEREFLISDVASPNAAQGSPLSKKGLRLLRTDMSTLEDVSRPPPPVFNINAESEADDDLINKYLKPQCSQEDSLAVAFAVNPFASKMVAQTASLSKLEEASGSGKQNEHQSIESAASISMSMDDTVTNGLFAGTLFALTSFSSEDEDVLKEIISELGGKVVGKNFKGVADYAIVPVFHDSLKITAGEILTDLWLSQCYGQKSLPELEYYHRPTSLSASELLDGCVLAMSGFNLHERNYLKMLGQRMGAVVQESLSRVNNAEKKVRANTHLICEEEQGRKFEAAVKWKIHVVNKEWILECARLEKRVDEFNYALGNTKENATMVNESSVTVTPKATRQHRLKTFNTSNLAETTETPPMKMLKDVVEQDAGCVTPQNNGSFVCSQITPVDKIMREAGFLDKNFPVTPKPWNFVETPDSPLGRIIQDPPPPELRKAFARWINGFPERPEPKSRRLSTPLSELKRQIWNRICPDVGTSQTNEANVSGVSAANVSGVTAADVTIPADETENAAYSTPEKLQNETPESAIVSEKLQQLQEMLVASGGSRRCSLKKTFDELPVDIHEKESQPFSVGWDGDIDCGVGNGADKKKNSVFMISGVDANEREQLISNLERLGATVSDLANFDPAGTHLLCDKLNRNEKLLGSMASGKWVLHISYIEDSFRAGKLLDEEEYEFGNSKCKIKIDSEYDERAKSAHFWRKEVMRRGYGVFHDMRAIIITSRKEPMVRVIEAGGGMVIDASPPFDEDIFATHCLLGTVSNYNDYVSLAQQGVYCVSTLYINEFLLRNVKDVRDFLIANLKKYYE